VKKLGIATLALGAVVSSFGTVTAHAAETTGPSGLLCGFSSVTDPGTEGGDVQTGELDAGPLLAIDDAATPPAAQTGTVKCTIQVGGGTHDAPDNGASASASGTGVIVLPATLVSYNSPANVPVYLCTQFTYSNGTTVYWADSNDPTVDGHWDTSATVACGLATEAGTEDADPVGELLDSVLCPVLSILGSTLPDVPGVLEIDNTGDVTLAGDLFWDCPPYV
jgi:hypothetical protein